MTLIWLFACNTNAELEERVRALEAEVASLKVRDAEVVPLTAPMTSDERAARIEQLQERLRQRRDARRADTDSPAEPPQTGLTSLREALGNPAAASRMGRALLHRGADGEFDGYRLSAIRKGSLTDTLGLENGDIVTHVAGVPLTSMSASMEAYSKARELDTVDVKIIRLGAEKTLQIPMD